MLTDRSNLSTLGQLNFPPDYLIPDMPVTRTVYIDIFRLYILHVTTCLFCFRCL